MKKLYSSIKSTLVAGSIAIMASSCMTTTHVQVLAPADLSLPDSIQKFVIANRSLPGEGNNLGNIVEGLFSGEGIGSDKRASGEALIGLSSGLVQSPRYDVTQSAETLTGTGTDQMPEPLPWIQVQEICEENHADALILLEVFDTDSKRRFDTEIKTRTLDGEKIEYTEHVANLDMRVTTGWRIYYPSQKMILDNFTMDEAGTYTNRADNLDAARNGLPSKEVAARGTGRAAGEIYASRIAPTWFDVRRSYYSSGGPDMKMARIRAQTNDWAGAAQIWQQLAQNSAKMKIRKRAAYNMALASEINGNIDEAIMWAKKARDMGEKNSRRYLLILEQRKIDEQRLQDQMGG